jgi:hypothetical protein
MLWRMRRRQQEFLPTVVPPPSLPKASLSSSKFPPFLDPLTRTNFFCNPYAKLESGNFAGARAFFIHHGHIIVYHDCPNAIAFQDLYPSANIGYISLLHEGLLTEGHCLLESQQCSLLCASASHATVPAQAPPLIPPPQSLLNHYVAKGFTHPPTGPPSMSAASSSCNPPFGAGSCLICSPSAIMRDYDQVPPWLLHHAAIKKDAVTLPLGSPTRTVIMTLPLAIMGGLTWHMGGLSLAMGGTVLEIVPFSIWGVSRSPP